MDSPHHGDDATRFNWTREQINYLLRSAGQCMDKHGRINWPKLVANWDCIGPVPTIPQAKNRYYREFNYGQRNEDHEDLQQGQPGGQLDNSVFHHVRYMHKDAARTIVELAQLLSPSKQRSANTHNPNNNNNFEYEYNAMNVEGEVGPNDEYQGMRFPNNNVHTHERSYSPNNNEHTHLPRHRYAPYSTVRRDLFDNRSQEQSYHIPANTTTTSPSPYFPTEHNSPTRESFENKPRRTQFQYNSDDSEREATEAEYRSYVSMHGGDRDYSRPSTRTFQNIKSEEEPGDARQ